MLAALSALAMPLAALAAPADDVKALMDQGKAADAYALGKQHPEELGNPAFDFYYGVSAIDAGHAGEGVLALERYVANFPDNLQARLELARGYYVLGDDARAREEFAVVQKANPPAGVQANIQRFIDAIRARESQYKTTAGFYAEAGIGYDSNVNGGLNSPNITLPIFGPVTLTTGVKLHDNFLTFAAGGTITHPIAPGVALFGTASADAKANNQQTAFDQSNVNLAGGASFIQDKNLWRVTGSYSELAVGHDWYRQATGLAGEVNHQLDELQTVSGFVQYAKLEYQPPQDVRNADLWALGAGYRRAFIGS
ncbi:MAG: tetratricopeptide repeat protein, partial [Clostridia bacterium]